MAPPPRSWSRWKDAFYNLLIARAAERDQATLGDALDAKLIERLLALGDLHEESWYHAAVADLGHDIGRLVYGRHIEHDELDVALGHLARAISQSGLARDQTRTVFHRRATVDLQPPFDLDGAHPPGPWKALLGGLYQGALEVAFNCECYISWSKNTALEVRLGDVLGSTGASMVTETGPPTEDQP